MEAHEFRVSGVSEVSLYEGVLPSITLLLVAVLLWSVAVVAPVAQPVRNLLALMGAIA